MKVEFNKKNGSLKKIQFEIKLEIKTQEIKEFQFLKSRQKK